MNNLSEINTDNRIETIDAFRCIAVLAVVVFHYYYRFSPPFSEVNYLPYQFEPYFLVPYGYYGVNFFFVISGFVISHTLAKGSSFRVFVTKRLIRLMPCLVLCSVITFFLEDWMTCKFPPVSGSYLNFLPGLTFLPPSFWNFVMNRHDIAYIDGSYWSLYPEMCFYIVGGIAFYLKPKAFVRNWVGITVVLTMIRIVTSPRMHSLFPPSMSSVFSQIYALYIGLHISYWVYFALGIFFYGLYSKRQLPSIGMFILIGTLIFSELYFLKDHVLRILFLGIILLFLIFIYRERWLFFMRYKIFLWIGGISYPVYLLHEGIGLILMNKVADILNIEAINRYMPLFAILVIFLMSDLIHRFFETPVIAFLRKGHSGRIRRETISPVIEGSSEEGNMS